MNTWTIEKLTGWMVVFASAMLLLVADMPAGAADRGTFTLTSFSQTASWSGTFQAGPPVPPRACVSSDVCDFVRVNVQLPAGVWAQPGGMLVATQPPVDFTNQNDFGLFVYGPGGSPVTTEPVANAEPFWSAGEHAAWVENPVNGVYTIVVAPGALLDPPAYYDGFVSFDRGLTVKRDELNNGMKYTQTFVAFGLAAPAPCPPADDDDFDDDNFDNHMDIDDDNDNYFDGIDDDDDNDGRHDNDDDDDDNDGLRDDGDDAQCPPPAIELLPDLVPTTPDNFHIETGNCVGFYACGNEPAHQPSCYAEETAGLTSIPPQPGPGPQKCLRFDQGEYNFGDGPFEIHIYPGQSTDVYQRVYRSDGSVSQQLVGGSVFHPSHGHFHYTGDAGRYRDATLHTRLPDGQPGALVATSPAKGICLLDIVNGRFGQRRDSPQAYGNDDLTGPCTVASHQDPNDPTFPNSPYIQAGISVGWADVYPWQLIDQYIDITKNVPDGKYVIVTKTDVDQRIREKTKANNTAMACVEISGMGTVAKPC